MAAASRPNLKKVIEAVSRIGGKGPYPLPLVRQDLDLPPIAYSRYLGADCWLAGGSVLRWLINNDWYDRRAKGDYDFYFPSALALDATARVMLDDGFQLNGYRAYSQTLKAYFRGAVITDRSSGLWDAEGRMRPITDELIERLRLTYLDLRSPQGDIVQLIAYFRPSVQEIIDNYDISVCQVGVDHRGLAMGEWTAHDLMHRRLRVIRHYWPDNTVRRLFKYSRRGFSPYPTSVIRAFFWLAILVIRKGPRLLLPFLRHKLVPSH